MVLKRLSNIIVLLFISFLLYAHPFIGGIEGYRVSPIALKGTDNFYLKNEICKANGIKIQTIYQFDFEEENIRIDARLTFTGSEATEMDCGRDSVCKIKIEEILERVS